MPKRSNTAHQDQETITLLHEFSGSRNSDRDEQNTVCTPASLPPVLPSRIPDTGRAVASNWVLIWVPHNFIPKVSWDPRYTSMFHCPLDIFTQCLTDTHLVISLRTKLMVLSPSLSPILLKGTNICLGAHHGLLATIFLFTSCKS